MKSVVPSRALVQLPPEMPQVPEYAIDIFGARVETSSADCWQIYTRPIARKVKWADFERFLSAPVIHALRLYSAHCIESLAPRTVIYILATIKRCLSLNGRRVETLQDLDLAFFEELRSNLRQIRRLHLLNAVRPWYYWMVERDLPGVDEVLVERLRSWVVRVQINGEAVMSLDPRDGPLSDIEI